MGQGQGGGRPLEGRSELAFEGLFVAGIGGSHPLGNRRGGRRDAGRRSRGRPTPPRRGLSGRSLVWSPAVTGETLCLLTSKVASATQQNTPPGRLQPLATKKKSFLLPRGYPWPRDGCHSVHKGTFSSK